MENKNEMNARELSIRLIMQRIGMDHGERAKRNMI